MTGAKILGLGNDIIEISRIHQSIERHGAHFLDRLFTKQEQDFCYKFQDPIPHFAGRFAAKEACAKAFGTGFGKELSWLDLEILGDDLGKPIIHIRGALKIKLGNATLHLSISHCKDYATAVVIWE